MDILIRYMNIYNVSMIFAGLIIVFITSIIYLDRRYHRKRFNDLKLKLIDLIAQKSKVNAFYASKISKYALNSVDLIAAFFAEKQFNELEPVLPLFENEVFQKKLRTLLKKGTTKERIDAANMLSYYPSTQTIAALKHACKNHNQEVAVAAALSLAISNPNVTLAELIILLSNSISQNGLFCFLRLVPSYKLLEFETELSNQQFSKIVDNLPNILTQISINYITPYAMLAKEDRRDYMRAFYESLIDLQNSSSGIIHSCYLLNFINEFCYQEKICSIEELITEYFDFTTKRFVHILDKNNNIFKIKHG
ncbi:hypothetical protein J3U35_02240 [Gilliamella sp. B2717]|uniref:hypothetical protein n=1 Tax=Gilliamella sp. B2717 TaxID=2817996 RepID=UPI00226AB2CA|nr:hypothetical protein [Gilliamella sp. B2717]MCX8578250.1 hypothetical protein [Gilliamella sp. B2717]